MKKASVVFGAIGLALAANAAGLSASNYLQDGLVLQFDGIDNAGTGAHDASATKWKDLKGSAWIDTGAGVTFGARWLYCDFKKGSISSFPQGLKNNPVTVDFSVNLVSNASTSASVNWPSLLNGPDFNLHSTGFKAGDPICRGFRLYINASEPRPYVYNINTNTLALISDASSIRILRDGVLQDSCASKAAHDLTWLVLNDSQMNQARFYSFRIYNRGLSYDEVWHNHVVEKLRYFAPRIAGTSAATAWSTAAWTDPDGAAVAKPSTATNGFAVVKNAAVSVAASDKVGLMGLSLEDDATLDLASDAVVAVRFLYVGGVKIARGIYTGTGETGTQVAWLTGSGVVRVTDSRTDAFPEIIPVPAVDGWYEIGNPATPSYNQGKGYSGSPNTGYHYFNGDLWTTNEYSRTLFPAGAKLRLVGGLITDTIPTDRFSAIDTTNKLKYIVFRYKTVFSDGRMFVVPSGCTARFQPGWWTLDGGKRWLTGAAAEATKVGTAFTGDLEVNGTLITSLDNTHVSDATFSGRVSGTGGALKTGSFANYQRFTADEFAFRGSASAGSSGTGFLLTPKRVTGRLSKLSCSGCGGNYQYYTSYSASGLLFGPKSGNPTCPDELFIGELEGAASLNRNPADGKLWRNGGHIIVWGLNTVHAGTVKTSVHVVARRLDQSCNSGIFGNAACFGTGNFIADTISSGANLFLGTNVYVTVGKVAGTTTFDYTYHSNNVNRMTLDITNTCASTAKVKATDLGMLPARLSGFAGSVELTDTAAGKVWTVPVDFSKGANALYQTVGCIGSGTLTAAPATGTINATFDANGTFEKGDYALARFTAGGERLADWTVQLNGENVSALPIGSEYVMRVHKDATGIWLRVTNPGLTIFLR